MSSRAPPRSSARPRRSRSRATSIPTPTRSAPCSGSRRSSARAGPTTVCSFPNEPLEPPRWASLLPGLDDLVEVADYPDAPAVMVTCDCASFDRLGRAAAAAASSARRGHLDRPPPFERRARDDPVGRSRRSSTCEMVFRLIDGDGRRHAGRDRGLPVRRPRHGHRPVPVRGHARPRRSASPPRSVSIRSITRAWCRRCTRTTAASTCGSRRWRWRGHGRDGGRSGLDVPDAGRPGRRGRRARGDRRPDRPHPHGPRRGRRGRAQATAGRTVQGECALARRARPGGDRRRLRRRRTPAGGRLHLGARPRRDDRAAGRRAARRARSLP